MTDTEVKDTETKDSGTSAALDMSCKEFGDALASSAPVPGGGGAAAYVGALGVALGHMVGVLTYGKKKYADVQDKICGLMESAENLQSRLYGLVDEDKRAFTPLSEAYRLPSTSDEEIAHKAKVMEECLINATEVPLQIMKACADAIDLHAEFARCGSKMAISDVGCGVVICKAALRAASLNVFINTKSMQDKGRADKYNSEANELLETYNAKAELVFEEVEGQLR